MQTWGFNGDESKFNWFHAAEAHGFYFLFPNLKFIVWVADKNTSQYVWLKNLRMKHLAIDWNFIFMKVLSMEHVLQNNPHTFHGKSGINNTDTTVVMTACSLLPSSHICLWSLRTPEVICFSWQFAKIVSYINGTKNVNPYMTHFCYWIFYFPWFALVLFVTSNHAPMDNSSINVGRGGHRFKSRSVSPVANSRKVRLHWLGHRCEKCGWNRNLKQLRIWGFVSI